MKNLPPQRLPPPNELLELATMREYFVYIMANASRRIYTGVTNNLARRVWEHKQKRHDGFTRRHNMTVLVYVETFGHIDGAIAREKEIKGWLRAKKVALIEAEIPRWLDLSADW